MRVEERRASAHETMEERKKTRSIKYSSHKIWFLLKWKVLCEKKKQQQREKLFNLCACECIMSMESSWSKGEKRRDICQLWSHNAKYFDGFDYPRYLNIHKLSVNISGALWCEWCNTSSFRYSDFIICLCGGLRSIRYPRTFFLFSIHTHNTFCEP